jgi:phosphatidate cytidylyltransferase
MEANPKPSSVPAMTVFLRRSASTLALWSVVAAVFFSHRAWAFGGLLTLLTVIATVEYFRILGQGGIRVPATLGVTLASVYSLGLNGFLVRDGVVPSWLDPLWFAVTVIGVFVWQLRRPIEGISSFQSVACTVTGMIYIPFLCGFLSRIVLGHGEVVGGWVSRESACLLLWVVAVTKFTDMGAYLTGSWMGRHKMIPHISPAKTWEGFVGALAFALLAGCGLRALMPGPFACFDGYGHVVLLSLMLAVLAVVGDLAESLLKRAVGAKDSGRILPGIGGALDLLDSLCFTAPVAYLYFDQVLKVFP